MSEPQSAPWPRGYVQVYTGDGKGKTTAAFGLAVRAVGAGLPVFIAQFVKGARYSERAALERFRDLLEIRQFGRDCFIRRDPAPADVEAARRGLETVREVFAAAQHRVVILDEVNVATHFGLIPVDDLLAVIEAKPDPVELVLTGRRADPRVIERADLVTEMREIKHYYTAGVDARVGIEK